MNHNPTDMANALTTIITANVSPWKTVLALLLFAYAVSKASHVEISGKGVTYSSMPACPKEPALGALPPTLEQDCLRNVTDGLGIPGHPTSTAAAPMA